MSGVEGTPEAKTAAGHDRRDLPPRASRPARDPRPDAPGRHPEEQLVNSSLLVRCNRVASDRVVLDLEGELDIAGASGMLTILEQAIEDGCDVEVNLDGLTFLDARGLSVFVKGRQVAADRRRSLALYGAGGVVARLLRICRVEQRAPSEPRRGAESESRPRGRGRR